MPSESASGSHDPDDRDDVAAHRDDEAAPATSRNGRRPGTVDPHRSRLRALKVLFQADVRDRDPATAIAEIAGDPDAVALLDDLDDDATPTGRPLDDYARTLIDGVATGRQRLDGIIGRFSHRWEVARMPVLDRNILRLATWELLVEDVSPAVVIDEALEMAKELSTDASHRFINGILESIRRESDHLRDDLTAAATHDDRASGARAEPGQPRTDTPPAESG